MPRRDPTNPDRARSPVPTPDLAVRPGATSRDVLAERRAAHTDADRDRARARLRVAQDRYRQVKGPYDAAVRERYEAAADAWDTGLDVRDVARVLGMKAHSNVQRMRDAVARRRAGQAGHNHETNNPNQRTAP